MTYKRVAIALVDSGQRARRMLFELVSQHWLDEL
jgi:hypothetical protein